MKTGRVKKPISLAIDPTLLARLDLWMRAQEAPWTKTAAVELALREFLDKRGNDDA